MHILPHTYPHLHCHRRVVVLGSGFTKPISGISPGTAVDKVEGLLSNIPTVNVCMEKCIAYKGTKECKAIIYRKGKQTCNLIDRVYETNYKKAKDDDDAVVANKLFGWSLLYVILTRAS